MLALITRKKYNSHFIVSIMRLQKRKKYSICKQFFSTAAIIVRWAAFVCISSGCHRRVIAQGLSYHMISHKCLSIKKLYHDLIKMLDLSNVEGWFKYNGFYKWFWIKSFFFFFFSEAVKFFNGIWFHLVRYFNVLAQ